MKATDLIAYTISNLPIWDEDNISLEDVCAQFNILIPIDATQEEIVDMITEAVDKG